MSNEDRIQKLENAVGFALPVDYRGFILNHQEALERRPQLVSSNLDYWDVHAMFELGDSEGFRQLDEVYRVVGDVVPAGMIPVAEDGAGNLWLLDCHPGSGGVYWWDHERNLGDDHVEKAADSFGQFVNLLTNSPDE